MSKVIEIVRLSEGGVPQRDIAAALRCSLATVNKTLRASRAKHLGSAELADQGEERARLLLFGPVEKVPLCQH